MSNRRKLAGGVALVLLVFVSSLIVRRLLVFTPDDLVVHTDQDFALEADADSGVAVFAESVQIDRDVVGHTVVAAETVTLSGRTAEDLTVMAETVDFSGQVNGSAVFMAEAVTLSGTIDGETVVIAERLTLGEGFRGVVTACVEQDITGTYDAATIRDCDRTASRGIVNRAGAQLASIGVISLLNNPASGPLGVLLPLPNVLFLTGLAALLVTIFPGAVRNIDTTVRANPRRMLATGGLVSLMAVGVTAAWVVLLAYLPFLGVIALPVYLLALLAFTVMLGAGWVTLALAVGEGIVRRVGGQSLPPLVVTVMGGLVLSALAYGLSWLPLGDLLGLAVFFLLGLAGLGAAYASRLGRYAVIAR